MEAKFKWKQRSSKVKKNDKSQKRNKNEPIKMETRMRRVGMEKIIFFFQNLLNNVLKATAKNQPVLKKENQSSSRLDTERRRKNGL